MLGEQYSPEVVLIARVGRIGADLIELSGRLAEQSPNFMTYKFQDLQRLAAKLMEQVDAFEAQRPAYRPSKQAAAEWTDVLARSAKYSPEIVLTSGLAGVGFDLIRLAGRFSMQAPDFRSYDYQDLRRSAAELTELLDVFEDQRPAYRRQTALAAQAASTSPPI